MPVSTFTQPNSATQSGSGYKANIDGASMVHNRIAGPFAPHAQSTPNMTVRIDAGAIPAVAAKPTEVAAQSTGTITAPTGNPRYDIIYIDQSTGAVGVATGAESASPSDPAVPSGKVAVARLALTVGMTSITNADLTDLRALGLLGLGDAATLGHASQAEAEAGSDNTKAMTPLRTAQAIAALASTADLTARDQIALTNLRQLLNTSVATGVLVGGYQWELASDEWGSSSTNETYNSGSINYYSNGGSPTQATGGTNIGNLTSNGGLAAAFDGNTSQGGAASAAVSPSNSGYNNTVGKDWGSGNTKTITRFDIYKATDNTNLVNTTGGVGYKLQGSNDNSAWPDLYSGTYPDSTASVSITSGITTSTAYRYHRLNINGNGSNGCGVCELVLYETGTPTNMTLIPPSSITVSAAPSHMDAFFLWKDDSGSAALGTDLTVELSRNNGTNYTTATLTNLGSFDGTYSIVKARADVSGQPSGTSMLARINTLNNKAQRVAAPAIYAE